MKNLLLLTFVSTLFVFSCSQEEFVDLENSEYLPTIVLENETESRNIDPSYSAMSKAALDIFVCTSIGLLTADDQTVGVVDFSLAYNKVIITYRVFDDVTLMSTNLSLIDNITNTNFPLNGNQEPIIDNFEFGEVHGNGVTEYTYFADQEQYADIYQFIAHAVVSINGNPTEVWSQGPKFTPDGPAMYSQMASGKCGADFLSCVEEDDLEFYIPLKAGTSGLFPKAGSDSDTVSLTQESPTSQGVLDLELEFDGFPPKYGNALLSITFDDLDLNPETISASGNKIVFSETFELRDEYGNLMAVLDETSNLDGNFTWTYDLPNNFFNDGKENVKLYATLYANLELIEGNGLHVVNTAEKMLDMSICGMQYGNIE